MVLEQIASGRAPDFLITAREAFHINSEAEAHVWALGGPDGIRALRRGVLPETIGTPDATSPTASPAFARVDAGWWIADCPNPRCNSAMALVRGARGFLCADCFNADVDRVYRPLIWPGPAEIRAVERELLKRPELGFMHWRPGVSVEELAGQGPFHHSWTAPKTYTVGAVGTAAERNTYERDNLLETAPAKFTAADDLFVATGANAGARLPKGSDGDALQMVGGSLTYAPTFVWRSKLSAEIVNNSATLQDDDDLFFPVGTFETWIVRMALAASIGSTTASIRIAVTVPADYTALVYTATFLDDSGGAEGDAKSTSGDAIVYNSPAATIGIPIAVNVHVSTSTTAGNIRLQFAQKTAEANNTQLLVGSHLIARQLQ